MKAHLICPVRNCTPETKEFLDQYVVKLEEQGYTVHYPQRDVDQTDDGIGFTICDAHRKAMLEADEIHILWDKTSTGSHFDFGMAFMLANFKPVKFVCISPFEKTPHKSYGNVLQFLSFLSI